MKEFEYPEIPNKRYFRIGEASELCGVKDSVLRYWEKEFSQIRPKKLNGHRHYRLADIQTIRKIRDLLYTQGFTITGAKQYLEAIEAREEEKGAEDFSSQTVLEPQMADFSSISSSISTKEIEQAIKELEKLKEFLHNN